MLCLHLKRLPVGQVLTLSPPRPKLRPRILKSSEFPPFFFLPSWLIMPPVRHKQTRVSSTTRRHNAIQRIQTLGRQYFGMGRCTNCQLTDSPCWLLEGQSMCGTCKRKGKKVGECDGCFSASEFDELTDQRERMQADIEAKDRQIQELISSLTAVQNEKNRLRESAENIAKLQKRMLSRELDALGEIDEASSSSGASHFAFALDSAVVPTMQQYVDFSSDIRIPGWSDSVVQS